MLEHIDDFIYNDIINMILSYITLLRYKLMLLHSSTIKYYHGLKWMLLYVDFKRTTANQFKQIDILQLKYEISFSIET